MKPRAPARPPSDPPEPRTLPLEEVLGFFARTAEVIDRLGSRLAQRYGAEAGREFHVLAAEARTVGDELAASATKPTAEKRAREAKKKPGGAGDRRRA